MATDQEIAAPGTVHRFAPDEVIIYGIKLNENNGVTSVTVGVGGAGYSNSTPPPISFTPAANDPGVGARARAIVSGAAVTRIVVENAGTGYAAAPTVNIGGPGAGATATAAIGQIDPAVISLQADQDIWDIRIAGVRGASGTAGRGEFQIVSAYGYAFEGYCYRFDKPKILAFQSGDGDTAHLGCGFDLDAPNANPPDWYRMWRLRSSNRVVQLNASVDEIQNLILEANLPGRRSPNTYQAQMQFAHRGGRVTST